MGHHRGSIAIAGVALIVLAAACSKANDTSATGSVAATTTRPSAATLDPCRLAEASDVSPVLGASPTHDEGTNESCMWRGASGADTVTVTLTNFDSPTKVQDYLTQNFSDETPVDGVDVGAIARYNPTTGTLTIGQGGYVMQVKSSTTNVPTKDTMSALAKTMSNNLLA